jgi:hypothetical protein
MCSGALEAQDAAGEGLGPLNRMCTVMCQHSLSQAIHQPDRPLDSPFQSQQLSTSSQPSRKRPAA